MEGKKKFPIMGLIGAIQNGIPLFKEVIGLFKKHPKTPDEVLNSLSPQGLILHIKSIEERGEKSFLLKVVSLIITASTVYFVVFTSKKFGITYQDIIDLFGLLK